MTLKTAAKETSLALEYFCLQPFVLFLYFFFTLNWGKNAIVIEFTRRIKEIKVINYRYERSIANGTLDPCKAPPCCYLQLQLQLQYFIIITICPY